MKIKHPLMYETLPKQIVYYGAGGLLAAYLAATAFAGVTAIQEAEKCRSEPSADVGACDRLNDTVERYLSSPARPASPVIAHRIGHR